MNSEHCNKVELLGYYGSDETHAASAWCSTVRDITPKRRARIPEFLKMLGENGHHTPFEKSMLHFLLTADVATHIHIIKHRIAVSVNTESARYKELQEDKLYVPQDWPLGEQMRYLEWAQEAQKQYHDALCRLEPVLGRKRAKESARYYQPYGNQVQMDVSFNWRSLMHFVGLRWTEHAQLEVREVAGRMLELMRETGAFPHSLAAFGY